MGSEILDIKIYHADDDGNPNRPRRIQEGEYHIEWHRTGIQFIKCPAGRIHSKNGIVGDIDVDSSIIVTWQQLMKPNSENEQFQFIQANGDILYVFRVIKREQQDWLDWCTKVPDNFNTEVLKQIAQIYEDKPFAQLSIKEIVKNRDYLEHLLPYGIDDSFCEIIREAWKQRLEERLIQDLLYADPNDDKGIHKVSQAVGFIKELIP